MKAPSSQKSPKNSTWNSFALHIRWGLDLFPSSMGRRAVDESNPWASLCPAGEKKGRKQMCVSNLCSWKKKKQENWFSNPGNLRLTESMSISLDSPCQTVCLHLPFLSLTTKLGSCLTRAALGCTCPFITFLWKKKKKASLTSCLKQHTKTVPKKREWNDFISHDGFKTCSKFSSYFFWS